MAVELRVPSAGESITEVQVEEWLKQEGDRIELDEPIVVLESDKAGMELPSPAAGTLKQILKQAGETVNVGEVLGILEEGVAELESSKDQERIPTEMILEATREDDQTGISTTKLNAADIEQQPESGPGNQAALEAVTMPAASRAAAEEGVNVSDIQGTGRGGRVLKEDVQRHKAGGQPEPAPPQAPATPQAGPVSPKPDPKPAPEALPETQTGIDPDAGRETEVVPMSRLRRTIANRLVEAQQTAALLTTFNEVNMSAVMSLRKEHQEAFVKKYGIKLGFMSFFVKAVVDGLKRLPAINAQIQGTDIVYHNYFDIGIAVGGGKGLVVPVIRNAERLSFAEIELTISEYATRARENRISVAELSGGTFTISNGGIYGSMLSTPIVNPPQSGILGMHAIQERPVAVDGEVVIRPMMYLALTYDHRIVDGQEAVTFLKRVKECIENPARMLIEV
ncbi:MAG: 2-oxoglutarate dehydrogenase complex dihydrolipoyllysine-residue succinyltransferase [Planctomycetota bacterium]|nr:2-oxoglutarate dehydrogenase complex dihydrolipoyllysine-residue succinyltransferase [Planctomycetota bacterium]MDA1138472.1 2-oxoglutarate dehydrogenase complex dihydrolipoyllysine-residue succinyltransferase [Planctomycetota bacterium]